MNVIEENNKVAQATQGATAAVFSTYFLEAYAAMIPWLIAAIPLIVLDLRLGRKKARIRGIEVTFNKSARMTIDKSFSYLCWSMLSVSTAMSFGAEWIKFAIMGIVYGLEVISCIKSWLITKGYDLDETEMARIILKTFWKKTTGTDDDFKNMIKKQDNENK